MDNRVQMLKSTQKPSGLLRWLVGTTKIHWIGESHLPNDHAIIITAESFSQIAQALLTQSAVEADHSLVSLPLDATDSGTMIRKALELGREQRVPVIPMAVAVAPVFSIPGMKQLPQPSSHIVACVEIPFTIPAHPAQIADDWVRAIQQQLRQANGRALDQLSTLRRASSNA